MQPKRREQLKRPDQNRCLYARDSAVAMKIVAWGKARSGSPTLPCAQIRGAHVLPPPLPPVLARECTQKQEAGFPHPHAHPNKPLVAPSRAPCQLGSACWYLFAGVVAPLTLLPLATALARELCQISDRG